MFDESLETCWQRRYGVAPQTTVEAIVPFLRHRSVRRYEDRPIEREVMTALLTAAQSASTSSNLQLWSAIRITDSELRAKVAVECAEQKQVHRAPEFLAFVADHARLKSAASQVDEPCDGFDYAEYFIMAAIDASLAAERLVCAAEILGIGACYIGALRNNVSAIQTLLNLPGGVAPLFGLCLGYPRGEAAIKPRLSQVCSIFENQYPSQPSIGDFDERMAAFYAKQQMAGETRWSKRSGKRVEQLTGREALKNWLESQGFWRR